MKVRHLFDHFFEWCMMLMVFGFTLAALSLGVVSAVQAIGAVLSLFTGLTQP